MAEEEKKEEQETHTERKTKCLYCSPWNSIASPPHRASTVWTLTFTLHGFLNYCQHLDAIYQVLRTLRFAVVFCPLGFQADWKERGSYQDISYSCFLSANNFGITLCKGHWSLKCCGLSMAPSLQGFGNF